MNEQHLKKRKKDENYYSELQERTRLRLAELSGKVWTDFNVHDPGVTISDYLNYALYDLDYRLQFPFESYLFSSDQDKDFAQKGLFAREDIYVNISPETGREKVRKSIVTTEDYEELFLKEHADILYQCRVRFDREIEKYKIDLFPRYDGIDEEEENEIIRTVKRTYHKNRNIGENIYSICVRNKQDGKLHKGYRRTSSYKFPEFTNEETVENKIKPFSANYHTIQNDFPENYGIGERGIPNQENTEYVHKVLQLKAYLLMFDQLMADQLQQAKNVSELFDLSEKIPATRLPEVSIVDGDRIVNPAKRQRVVEEIQEKMFYHTQKFRYLNLLDVIYGEDTRTLFGKKNIPELNKKRALLLQSLPKINEARFRSLNIFEPNSIPVIQHLIETIDGDEVSDRPVHYDGVRVLTDEDFFDRYRFLLSPYRDYISEEISFTDVPDRKVLYNKERWFGILRLHMNLVWYGVLFESFLVYGTEIENYKIMEASDEYLLVFFHPEKKIGINMSLFFSDRERLIEMTHLFLAYLRKIKNEGNMQSFYLLEHILLGGTDSEENSKVSIVISENERTERTEIMLRERLPAHLQITLYYLHPEAHENFHLIYFGWRKALAEENNSDEKTYATALRAFLTHVKDTAKEI